MRLRRLASVMKNTLFKKAKPSLGGLDDRLAKYLGFDGGFFIEAGANDGYSQSNTYYLEKTRNWSGLLVEGIPELAVKARKARPRSRVVQCALVGSLREGTTVTMRFAHLMSLVDGAMKSESEEDDHIASGLRVQHLDKSYKVEVPARTLESVLDENPPSQIDFFSLDVEGYELQVLEGLNLDRYRPRYLLVEARFFDEVNSFLVGHGYDMVEKMSYHDYFYRDSRQDK